MARGKLHKLPSVAARDPQAAYIVTLHTMWLDEYVKRGLITKGQRAQIHALYIQGVSRT